MALAPSLTYPGNITEEIVGRVMGPDTAGGYVRVISATYDEARDKTLVRFTTVDPTDTSITLDEHRQAVLR